MPTSFKQATKASFIKARSRVHAYKMRRSHRSFQLTRRRDYARSLQLPGYFAFTHDVHRTIWKFRRILFPAALLFAILTVILVGLGSQETYDTLTSTLKGTSSEIFEGNIGAVGQAALLLVSIGTTGLTASPSEGQQIYGVLLSLLIWLTTIWLMRNLLAGHKVRVRDGLYNAGSPIISTFVIAIVLAIQLLPIALAIIAFSAASATGLLAGGVEAMLFWFAASLLVVLSLYWITSTFFALIIVSLPGTYPLRALRIAGDMVHGRRIRILLRILWMFACTALTWALVMIPFILFDSWLKSTWPQLAGVPIIPVLLLLMGVGTLMWTTSYVYLLYRKVVDDDAKPA